MLTATKLKTKNMKVKTQSLTKDRCIYHINEVVHSIDCLDVTQITTCYYLTLNFIEHKSMKI